LLRRGSATILSVLLCFASLSTAPSACPAALPPPTQDSGENQFGTSISLFSTLAAINAAGYDAGIDSVLNARYKVRTQVRDELAKRKIPCLPELKAFYQQHKKASDTADLSQYISFALVSSGPPDFEVSNYQLPPDVEQLKGLGPLLARFYREASLEDLWNRSQPAFGVAIGEYQDPVINTLFEANGYMRNPSGYLGRRFQIYLDLLGAPDQVQVRSYRDDYYVVITPTTVPVVDEIREAYLAYVLDPLSFKYSEALKAKKSLEKYAQDAGALDLAYKDDFSLLVTKCLVKAIDSRLMRDSEKREAFVNQAVKEGFILTAAFSEQLVVYEKQQESLRIYYPELVNAVNVRKEEKRLKTVEFVQSVKPRVVAAPSKLELNPAEASLESAEGVYEQGQYQDAAKLFKKVFEQTADKALQGRAYYGLARIAVRENRKDEAVELFQRTADANPDPAITAWAHVYLGRLALAGGDFNKANAEFKSALANEGASAMARQAAEKGLQSSSSSSNPGDKQQ
jgi:predicted negative regulator of RcsB-dependent stress response